MNKDYRSVLRIVAINFLARLFSNCYEEACAAYLLSGKERMNIAQPREDVGRQSEKDDVETGDPEGEGPALGPERYASTLRIGVDDLIITEVTVAERLHDNILILRQKSLDELLSWDFDGDAFEKALQSFARYGVPLGRDLEYFRNKLIYWLDEFTGPALAKAASIDGKSSVPWTTWRWLESLSRWDTNWRDWKIFASLAMRYLSSAVSEADVEHALSVQKHILGLSMTNISLETLHARMILHGKRKRMTAADLERRTRATLQDLLQRYFGDVFE